MSAPSMRSKIFTLQCVHHSVALPRIIFVEVAKLSYVCHRTHTHTHTYKRIYSLVRTQVFHDQCEDIPVRTSAKTCTSNFARTVLITHTHTHARRLMKLSSFTAQWCREDRRRPPSSRWTSSPTLTASTRPRTRAARPEAITQRAHAQIRFAGHGRRGECNGVRR